MALSDKLPAPGDVVSAGPMPPEHFMFLHECLKCGNDTVNGVLSKTGEWAPLCPTCAAVYLGLRGPRPPT
jgi:hypothetical protein